MAQLPARRLPVQIDARARPRGWAGPPQRPRRPELPRLRVLWLLAVAALLATAVEGRLAYWQVAQHGRLSAAADAQHFQHLTLPATRGVILDRNGSPLAINTVVYNVFVSPVQVPPGERARTADALATVLGVNRDDVVTTLASGTQFAYISKRLPKDRADQLAAMSLGGVGLEPVQGRTYLPGGTPDVSLASQLLGFVDYAGQGQRGVEASYQAQLGGRSGYVSTYRDLAGNEISLGTRDRRDPLNGADLQLTIDSNLQYAAEQAIAAGVKKAKAQQGSVLIMDPRTGGIIAWASYPSYDANRFATADPALTRDPIASNSYEPGSVMKVVTLAGAMDVGKITPQTSFNDPGYVAIGGATIHDWDLRNHGTVTMTNVLEKSLNVGAIKAMQLEGRDSFLNQLRNFGFGQPSGVDVADETSIPLRDPAQWRDVELGTASFGQGIAVNMVQMLSAVNVVANSGRYAPPHVVERVNGQPVAGLNGPQRQVISPATAAQMTEMMKSVVQNGSGWTARVPGFELDQTGKTGTSNIPEGGAYSPDHVWASYVGSLPASDPRFTMLVMVRQPNNGSFDSNEGYYVSAPIWKQIAQQIILDWRITPNPAIPRAGARQQATGANG